MKLDYFACSAFIKRKLKIRLFPYQETMLKAMCEGLEIRTARSIGRTFVADCLGKYVASLYDKNNYEKEPDVTFPYTCAIEPGVITEQWVESIKKDMTEEDFKRELLCI